MTGHTKPEQVGIKDSKLNVDPKENQTGTEVSEAPSGDSSVQTIQESTQVNWGETGQDECKNSFVINAEDAGKDGNHDHDKLHFNGDQASDHETTGTISVCYIEDFQNEKRRPCSTPPLAPPSTPILSPTTIFDSLHASQDSLPCSLNANANANANSSASNALHAYDDTAIQELRRARVQAFKDRLDRLAKDYDASLLDRRPKNHPVTHSYSSSSSSSSSCWVSISSYTSSSNSTSTISHCLFSTLFYFHHQHQFHSRLTTDLSIDIICYLMRHCPALCCAVIVLASNSHIDFTEPPKPLALTRHSNTCQHI